MRYRNDFDDIFQNSIDHAVGEALNFMKSVFPTVNRPTIRIGRHSIEGLQQRLAKRRPDLLTLIGVPA